MIRIRDIEKSYRGKSGPIRVLRGATADFPKGRSTGIIGANGVGKSTLLRIIAGAERPNFGTVTRTRSVSWPLGFSGSFAGSLSGSENLRFVCRIYGADIDEVTDFVTDFAELGPAMKEPVKSYSSGMRQRLAFALSMAINFQVYIIDESLAVGDASFQAKCQDIFDRRRADSDVIMTSHSIDMIKQYCSRAAVLHGGELTVFESVDEAHDFYIEATA